jgi:hypothetical protein
MEISGFEALDIILINRGTPNNYKLMGKSGLNRVKSSIWVGMPVRQGKHKRIFDHRILESSL